MKKILIVGAGVSGLTTGILALKQGYEVTIAEASPRAGGLLSSWEREGFNVENCLFKGLRGTAKGSSSRAIYEEIGLLKKDEEFFSPAYLYSSSTGDKTIYAYKDLRKLEEELTQTSPSDKWRIKELVFALTECAKIKKDFKNPPPVTKMARLFKTPVGWSDYFAKEKIFGGASIEDWAHSFTSPAI